MTMRLDIASLAQAYADGSLTPEAVLDEVFARIARKGERPDWIMLLSRERALARLAEARASGQELPLFGVPFAVKDNIDVAGVPTTAGCPDFAYTPERSATVVTRLEQAGAMLVGKTNLDQFATGLVGVRSPYGIPTSVFDPAYISGGSSSGSAVAVAAGLVCFSLGTDTAGSGRVPAAFGNIVGLKPSRGAISTRGVVPACRSLDCVSIFAGSTDDAYAVLDAAVSFDAEDPFSAQRVSYRYFPMSGFRFGVPASLEFFGDGAAAALYESALERLAGAGGTRVEIDYAPFRGAAELLYEGPYLAERKAALRGYGFDRPNAMDPVVRSIIDRADGISAVETFEAMYELRRLIQAARREWERMDVLVLPTAPTTYTIDQVQRDPIELNRNLGYYTNFVNLMDLSAVAVPAGFRPDGLPFGVTVVGLKHDDWRVAVLADRLHRTLPAPAIGATGQPLPPPVGPLRKSAEPTRLRSPLPGARIPVAVVGAHLSGQPLNWQLETLRGRLVRTARTAVGYSLYVLPGTTPPKPGLVRDGGAGAIELEIWELEPADFAKFVANIPAPLGVGTLLLDDGSSVQGFLCESYAVAGAQDITALGGWRAYVAGA
jgi:allophanate hydrolase